MFDEWLKFSEGCTGGVGEIPLVGEVLIIYRSTSNSTWNTLTKYTTEKNVLFDFGRLIFQKQ